MRRMKITWIRLLFALTLLLVFSCKSDDDLNTDDDGEYLTALIDGTTRFEATTSPNNFIKANVTLGALGPKLKVFGHFNDNDHEEMVILIDNYSGAGSYTAGDTINPVVMYLDYTRRNISYGAYDNVGQGSINITTDNEDFIEGTFNFIGINGVSELQVTQGRFMALYDFKATN
jgi:hypothetical protein